MKKLISFLVLSVGIIGTINADPAKKVVLTYAQGKLNIKAIHPVKDVNDHYIDQLIILIDGKEFKTIKPTKQSSKEAEVIDLELPNMKAGSTIVVKTRCNEFGSKSGKLTIK